MAHVDLAADLHGAANATAGMGRILGCGLSLVATSGQGVGGKAALRPAVTAYPKETLKVDTIDVKRQTP